MYICIGLYYNSWHQRLSGVIAWRNICRNYLFSKRKLFSFSEYTCTCIEWKISKNNKNINSPLNLRNVTYKLLKWTKGNNGFYWLIFFDCFFLLRFLLKNDIKDETIYFELIPAITIWKVEFITYQLYFWLFFFVVKKLKRQLKAFSHPRYQICKIFYSIMHCMYNETCVTQNILKPCLNQTPNITLIVSLCHVQHSFNLG